MTRYTAVLPHPMTEVTLKFAYVLLKATSPRPTRITQFQQGEADLHTNVCPVTDTVIESCQVVVSHSKEISIQTPQYDHSDISATQTTIGPIEALDIMEETPITIHYMTIPHMKIRHLTRRVDLPTISSYVSVEDYYEGATNEGAEIVGGFSREDFQQNMGSYPNAIGYLSIGLPSQAVNIGYRDTSGNISTSSVSYFDDNITLVALPRYPLLSGWTAEFFITHKVLLSSITEGEDITIQLPQLTDAAVENLTVIVTLPDSATFTSINSKIPAIVDVEERNAFLSFATRQEVTIHLHDLSITNTTSFTLRYVPSTAAAMSTYITVAAYVCIFIISFLVVMRHSA